MKRKIALIQMQVEMGNPDRNYSHCETLIGKAMQQQPDILVLPETWNTGFYPKEHLVELADPDGKRTQDFLSSFAKKHAVNIVGGSVAVLKDGKVYNRCYIFNRKGQLVETYDKIHGFSPAGENDFFAAGNRTVHFTLGGLSCSMAICYDVRFPELIRRETLAGVDLFFLPAAWPKARAYHWVTLCRARAIENQMYLAAVNEGGLSGDTTYAGESMLLSPWGEDIIHLGTNEEIACGTIDTDVLTDIRNSINVYRDRKPDIDIVM